MFFIGVFLKRFCFMCSLLLVAYKNNLKRGAFLLNKVQKQMPCPSRVQCTRVYNFFSQYLLILISVFKNSVRKNKRANLNLQHCDITGR